VFAAVKLLELFAGSRSIGRVAERKGWRVCSVDLQPFKGIDIVGDVLTMNVRDFPFVPDAIWASPPCTSFSVLSLAKHWTPEHQPKTVDALLGVELVRRTIAIIRYFEKHNPYLAFYIENPRGKLRKLPVVAGLPRATVTYCKYGDTRMKPTDIWTNNLRTGEFAGGWKPRPMCTAGNPNCRHEQCSGGLCGVAGQRGAYERSKIPAQLAAEVIDAV
jgi:site-specific DNA-cytosine methylase